MEVLRDGTFSFTIGSDALSLGLRPSKRSPRNTKYLVECVGAVGIDKVLQVIDDLENNRIDTSVIIDAFPYPQIFVLNNTTLVCGREDIYEYALGTLTKVIGPVLAGQLWSVVDYYGFIYMSNFSVSILRDPNTNLFSLITAQPVFSSICDFNGQVMIGGL